MSGNTPQTSLFCWVQVTETRTLRADRIDQLVGSALPERAKWVRFGRHYTMDDWEIVDVGIVMPAPMREETWAALAWAVSDALREGNEKARRRGIQYRLCEASVGRMTEAAVREWYGEQTMRVPNDDVFADRLVNCLREQGRLAG